MFMSAKETLQVILKGQTVWEALSIHQRVPIFEYPPPILISEPGYWALAVSNHLDNITLPDGYTLNIMEYLAEQPHEFLVQILKEFHIDDFRGTSAVALDFFQMMYFGQCHKRDLVDCHGLSYQEILKRGEQMIGPSYNEASLLNAAVHPGTQHYPGYHIPYNEWDVLDVVRYVLYVRGREDYPCG